jgi:hypothetical protein
MDATLYGYHSALRQNWAPNNAGGSAELKGTVPPPKIDEAPTFDQYGKLAQLFLISTGKGGPGSVADGKTVGKTGRLSKEALACLGAELWSEEDLENNGMHLNFAYLQHNATALGIHHAPLPKDAERRLVWMINAGITDPQFKANAPPPATSPSGDMKMETAPAEAVELVKKVSAARDALQAAPDDTAAKAALGDLEAQLAEIMLTPPPARRPGAASQFTVQPRASLPPKPQQPTPKNLADGTMLRLLQQRGAGAIFLLQQTHPTTTALVSGGGTPASVDTMQAAMLDHCLAFMTTQAAVHKMVVQSLAVASETTNFDQPIAALTGDAADATYAALLGDGLVQLKLPAWAIFWGIVPRGDFAMGVARSYHVPQPNPTVAVLLRATALLDFRNRDGDLDLQRGSKQIVDALGKTRGGAARADYDMAFRNVVAAVARVSALELKGTGGDGVPYDWSSYALALVARVAGEGLAATAFDSQDFIKLSNDIARFSRLQALRTQQHQAVARPGGGAAASVRVALGLPPWLIWAMRTTVRATVRATVRVAAVRSNEGRGEGMGH